MNARPYKRIIVLLLALALFASASVPVTGATVLLGDLDADGVFAAADARLALRLAVKLDPLTEGGLAVGDVNGDGAVTAADARSILRASVKLEDFGGKTVEAEVDPYAAAFASLNTVIPPAPEISADHGTFTFVTYGWGHCVGLSQQGAVMMANAGIPYDRILGYYFVGSKLISHEYPETTRYVGADYNTEELLCSIVSGEIGVAPDEALKAQAVCIFTLLVSNDFRVTRKDTVGYAAKYANCSDRLKAAVHEVIGQMMVLEDDPAETPVLAVYGDMAAGRTLGCAEVWGGGYPVSVPTPFEAIRDDFYGIKTLTAEELKAKILAWDATVVLSDNPAEWLEITAHDACLDENRGYVKEIRVGNKTIKGIGAFSSKITYLRSPCYTVTYTP